VAIRRTVYAASGGGTVTPADGYLGIVTHAVSVGARELACRATMAGVSFKKAAANLEHLAQIRMGHERLWEIAEAEGRAVVEATEAGKIGPDWAAADCVVTPGGPTRLLMGCDGVQVPVVTAAEKQKRRATRRRGRKARRRRNRRR